MQEAYRQGDSMSDKRFKLEIKVMIVLLPIYTATFGLIGYIIGYLK